MSDIRQSKICKWLLGVKLIFITCYHKTLELVFIYEAFCVLVNCLLFVLVIEDSLEIYTPEHSYIMYAATKNEKKVWLQKLRTAVAQALHGEEANESYEIGNESNK